MRIALTLTVLVALCAGCDEPRGGEPASLAEKVFGGTTVGTERAEALPVGRTVYVPVYSSVFYQEGKSPYGLAINLSVRNTDLESPIVITSVAYHGTEGAKLREYLAAPRELGPLGTLTVVVAERDRAGGEGANFIVEWRAKDWPSEPIVKAVMVGTSGTQGISFSTSGTAIRDRGK